MPSVGGITVTNINTGQVWQPTAPATVIMPQDVRCVTNAANQPPVGFVNNPAHTFTVTGHIMPTGMPFNAAGLHTNPAVSEPPLIFAFH